MQFIAQLILALVGIYVFFWTLGFWWGLGVITIYILSAVAKNEK